MSYLKSFYELLRVAKRSFDAPLEIGNPPADAPRALMCYISRPFRDAKFDHEHSNQTEVRRIAKIIQDLGFALSVINFNSEYQIDYRKYDLLFGFGRAFDRSFYTACHATRIFHLTTANPGYSNLAEARRLRFARERGHLIGPQRIIDEPWVLSAVLSDGIIGLGNDWTRSTYADLNDQIFMIRPTYVASWDGDKLERDWALARREFLWLGGSGALHKGLDVLLEAFAHNADLKLHVCGRVKEEQSFFNAYEDLLGLPNVAYHGFVDVRGQAMREIFAQAAFAILPSCAEGYSTSVLTCMHAGMIPVVTPEFGINTAADFIIHDVRPGHLSEQLKRLASLDPAILRAQSSRSEIFAKENHRPEKFEEAVADAISMLLCRKRANVSQDTLDARTR